MGTVVLTGINAIESKTGVNFKKAYDEVSDEIDAQDIEKLGSILYEEYNFKLNAIKHLQEILSEYVENE